MSDDDVTWSRKILRYTMNKDQNTTEEIFIIAISIQFFHEHLMLKTCDVLVSYCIFSQLLKAKFRSHSSLLSRIE